MKMVALNTNENGGIVALNAYENGGSEPQWKQLHWMPKKMMALNAYENDGGSEHIWK